MLPNTPLNLDYDYEGSRESGDGRVLQTMEKILDRLQRLESRVDRIEQRL